MAISQAVAEGAASPLRGIVLKVMSVVAFVGMQTSIKLAGEGVPAGEIVFFRSFFALVPVVAYLFWLGDLATALRTEDFPGHVVRGLIGVTSMALGFFALTRLPYPEWISLSYASPLFTIVAAAVVLKEKVRIYRWTAVCIGLVGILVVSAPNLTLFSEGLDRATGIGMIASLGASAVGAIAMIQVRRLVRFEKTATIVVYFSLTCSGIALFTLPFGWVWPEPRQLAFLILSGLCGGVGQLLLTACYRHADTSTIAPFEYSSLFLAMAIGYFLFGEVVSPTTFVGGLIVVAAGTFIIFRESRLGIKRRKVRKVTPPPAS